MKTLTNVFAGVFAAFVLFGATSVVAQAADDRAQVERAVLDYVEGIYDVKPELIERSVHPDLVKFGFARRSPEDDWRVIPMSYERLVELAGEYYALTPSGTRPSPSARRIELHQPR